MSAPFGLHTGSRAPGSNCTGWCFASRRFYEAAKMVPQLVVALGGVAVKYRPV
jgi:hypothetical protein